MARTGRRVRGGARWIDEHVADPFVRRARAEGYRSRAAYKLLEIDRRDHLFHAGQVVVDLGAAPGSWSQVARDRVGRSGRVVAIDLLPIQPLPGVTVIEGDFTQESTLGEVVAALGGAKADLVLSDMAPNLSGIAVSDQARVILLAELALQFAREHLKPTGTLVVKTFQGSGFPQLFQGMRTRDFASVVARKPDASRGRSPELYLVARKAKWAAG